MPRKKITYEYKLYIPNSIDIDFILKNNPPKFKFQRDKFVAILHMLSSINADRKDEAIKFTYLYSPLLKRKIGSAYLKYLQYLISQQIIVVDGRYSTSSHFSKSYSFSEKHLSSELQEILITDRVTIRNIQTFFDLQEDRELQLLSPKEMKDFTYLTKWFNEKLTIDFTEARKCLLKMQSTELLNEMLAYERYMSNPSNKILKKQYEDINNPYNAFNKRIIPVFKLKNKQFITSVDRTSFRLHTPLTSLKKELRRFVKYDGKTLVSIDIKNSQPYLSTVLFDKKSFKKNQIQSKINLYNKLDYNNSPIAYYYVSNNVPPKDVTLFIKHVTSGRFYEEFVKILDTAELIPQHVKDKRSYSKEVMFRTFFSPNYHKKFSKEIQVFEKIYPNVFENFSFLKSNKKFNTLACLLQRIESELILEIICKEISDKFPSVPIFTIHDSVVTTIEHVKKVEEIMRSTLTEFIGFQPQLSIEKWE